MVHPTRVGTDVDAWGIDHGTWSVLVHAVPPPDIPVVQRSNNAEQDFEFHLELGARLAPLRESGVLILGSGNVVHNLRGIDRSRPDDGFDCAQRFDEDTKTEMVTQPTGVARLDGHSDFRVAVPTPGHFLPLLYISLDSQARPERQARASTSLSTATPMAPVP